MIWKEDYLIMKRFLAVVMALVLVFSMAFGLTACSSGDECEICGATGKLNSVDYFGSQADLCKACENLLG